jgi:hypothetical protein
MLSLKWSVVVIENFVLSLQNDVVIGHSECCKKTKVVIMEGGSLLRSQR